MHARLAMACASAIVCSLAAAAAHADPDPTNNEATTSSTSVTTTATSVDPSTIAAEDAAVTTKLSDASTHDEPDPAAFHPHVVADVRFGGLFRNDSDYFSEAETFGYPVSSAAPGVVGTLGLEVVPRLTIGVAGSYYSEGAKRRFAKLMLSSDALLAQIRFAVLRAETTKDVPVGGALEIVGGGGKYWIRESYSDPSLFAGSIQHDATSFGFSLGADASVNVGPARFVLGYAYHWAPAGVKNDIGGEVRAGGHEITLGLGARF